MRKFSRSAQFFCAFHLTPARVSGAFAAAALVFAACTARAEPLPTDAPPCDYQGRSGICVRVDRNAARFDPAALEAAYVRAKRDVEMRYGLDLAGVPGPVVRVMRMSDFARIHPIHNRLDGDLGGDHGRTIFGSGEIRITGPAVMRHEAFHYLLAKAGYPNHLNAAHDHPVFDEFRDGKWLPKRASAPLSAPAAQKSQADPASLSPRSPSL